MKNCVQLIAYLSNLIILMSSCQYSPYADKYLTEEPTVEDVAGVYEFYIQTVDFNFDEEKIKNSSPVIIIKADKTFELKNIPHFKDDRLVGYNYQNGVSKKGEWTFGSVGSIDFGSGDIRNHWGIILKSVPEEMKYAGLMGDKKANGIIFGYGDPDEGDVMIFKKK